MHEAVDLDAHNLERPVGRFRTGKDEELLAILGCGRARRTEVHLEPDRSKPPAGRPFTAACISAGLGRTEKVIRPSGSPEALNGSQGLVPSIGQRLLAVDGDGFPARSGSAKRTCSEVELDGAVLRPPRLRSTSMIDLGGFPG